jgi:hypothetical protein
MSAKHSTTHSTTEMHQAYDEIQVPGDGKCFLHAVKANLARLGHSGISINELQNLLDIRELAWTESDDRRGIGEDFEPIILRLSKVMEVSVVLFVYSGDDTYYRYHKGNGTETVYLKLRSRHYTALNPRLDRW